MHEDRYRAKRGKHRKRRLSHVSTFSIHTSREGVRQRTAVIRPQSRRKASFLKITLLSLGSGAAVVVPVLVGVVIHMLQGLPRVSASTFTNQSIGSIVYDIHGRVLGRFSKDGERQPIESLNEVSDGLISAFIAAEDKTFFHNLGVNPMAMVRALAQNVVGRRIESGASTITQQTVKLAVFPQQQRTIKRKIQEIALSLEVNQMLTKDEIMTDYMNWVYMGRMGSRNVYGVKTAAQILFHKEPRQLNVPESAYLAAIPNNPTYFSPYLHPAHTLSRQHYILSQMLQNGTITRQAYQNALAYPIQASVDAPPSSTERYPYIMRQVESTVTRELVDAGLYRTAEEADSALPTSGYRIYTTINLDMQNRMDTVLSRERLFQSTSRKLRGVSREDLYQAAMTMIDNATGDIVAMDGGRPNHYKEDQIDHTDIARQPGSAIKPLVVYGPAIEGREITAGSLLDDGPGVFNEGLPWQYQPKDDVPWWHGMVTVRQALVESLNLPAIRVLNRLRPEVGTRFLPALGIHIGDRTRAGRPTLVEEDTHHLGTGIGGLTYGLTLEQMTGAYTVFPNQGVWREPVLIRRITDQTGSTLFAANPLSHRVFSPQTAFIMTSILRDVISRPDGTARFIGWRFPGAPIAGKTGTTDDQENGWFIGYTPQYTTGIWMGYNHNEPIASSVYGLKFRFWGDLMRPWIPSRSTSFSSSLPADVVAREICRKSGALAVDACRQGHTTIREWFIEGTEPTRFCELHGDASTAVDTGKQSDEAQPEMTHVSALESESGVALSWDPVPRAGTYTIWRSLTPTGPFIRIGSATPLTIGADSTVPPGATQIYYQIHAELGDGSAIPSKTLCLVLHGPQIHLGSESAIPPE